jgi:tyrosinase
MNYDRYAEDPINSPMFNGNASSMGGNGAPTKYRGIIMPFKKPNDMIKSAGGGGCVTTGPFKDMVVSLGPKSTVVDNVPKNPQADGLGANPRCLRRDVNRNSALGATANYTYSLIMDNKDIDSFYNRYLGQPPLKNDNHPWGLHNAGHYIIGGDPGGVSISRPSPAIRTRTRC